MYDLLFTQARALATRLMVTAQIFVLRPARCVRPWHRTHTARHRHGPLLERRCGRLDGPLCF